MLKENSLEDLLILKNGTKEQYEAAKKSGTIVFAKITDSSK